MGHVCPWTGLAWLGAVGAAASLVECNHPEQSLHVKNKACLWRARLWFTVPESSVHPPQVSTGLARMGHAVGMTPGDLLSHKLAFQRCSFSCISTARSSQCVHAWLTLNGSVKTCCTLRRERC
eukprot:364189-Chlamydomonas_euryale.AAC.35